MEDTDSGEFNIHEAADEIIASESGDSGSASLDSDSQDGQSQDSVEKPEGSNELGPEEILKQLSEEKESPEQFAEILKNINSLGMVRNGLPINIESKEQLTELVQKGFDYTQKTMEHAEIVKAKDAEFVQKEAQYKEVETQLAQKEQEISNVIFSNQIMGSIVERLQAEDPELFDHLDKLYRNEEKSLNLHKPIQDKFDNQIKELSGQIAGLKNEKKSEELGNIKKGWESDLSELQTKTAASLSKLGVKVDYDKVKSVWQSDASGTMTVEQAMYAAYGKEIASANESHKKLLTTKAKNQEKLLGRTGINAGQRGGEVAIEAEVGDFMSILRQPQQQCEEFMTLSVSGVQALTVKGIEAKGGVRDAIFKDHAYLSRLKLKEGVYSGEKMTFPFNYMDDTQTNGKFYVGAESLSQDMYDPLTELSFDLIELEETLVIAKRDLAKNSGKEARLKLVEQRLKTMKSAMQQRFTKGIFSDGTASTGAMTTAQFQGIQSFLKSSAVNYGNVTSTDISVHIAYVNDNSGTLRALTTALHQAAIGGASEGNKKPTVGIMRQNVMDKFIELLKPHQRTTRESTLNGLGHEKNTLVYSGIDHIVDNLSPASSIAFLNEENVKLYVHPEYNLNRESFDKLENFDGIMERMFWKGIYACDVLRYQSWLKDITV